MDAIVTYFRNIIIFLIFINFVEIILPNKKYKNYMDFVLGLILISIVISPIVKLLKLDAKSYTSQVLTNNSQNTSYTNNVDYTKALYESQVCNQLESYLVNTFDITPANIKIVVSDDYAALQEIHFDIKNNSVEPINISTTNDTVESPHIIDIKNKISLAYNLSVGNIHINIAN